MGFNIYEDGAWKDRTSSLKRYKDGAWTPLVSAKVYENGAWVEKLGIPPYSIEGNTTIIKWAGRISGSMIELVKEYGNGLHYVYLTVAVDDLVQPLIEIDDYVVMSHSTEKLEAVLRVEVGKYANNPRSYFDSNVILRTKQSEFGENFSWIPTSTEAAVRVTIELWYNNTTYNSDYLHDPIRAIVTGFKINGQTVIGNMTAGEESIL